MVLKVEEATMQQSSDDREIHVNTIPYRNLYTLLIPSKFPVHPQIFNQRQQSLLHSGLWLNWSNLGRLKVRKTHRTENARKEYVRRKPSPIKISYNIKTIFYLTILFNIPTAVLLCLELEVGRSVFLVIASNFLHNIKLAIKKAVACVVLYFTKIHSRCSF